MMQSDKRIGARGMSSRYLVSRHSGASPVMRTAMLLDQYVTVARPSVQIVNDCASESVSLYIWRHDISIPLTARKVDRKSATLHGSDAGAGAHAHRNKLNKGPRSFIRKAYAMAGKKVKVTK